MDTVAGTRRVRLSWRRLAKWQRRLLIVVAVLVCSAWVGISSIVLLVLLDSFLGCPPTMGCPEPTTWNCSSLNYAHGADVGSVLRCQSLISRSAAGGHSDLAVGGNGFSLGEHLPQIRTWVFGIVLV